MKRLTIRDESGFYHLRRGPKGGEINKITVVQHLGRLEDVALRPVRREQVEKVWPGCPYCKEDGEGYVQKFGAYSIQNGELATGHCKSQKIKFCPHCSRPLTDEAVQMVMERLEALYEHNA